MDKQYHNKTISQVFGEYQTSQNGLNSSQVGQRQAKFGKNALIEKKRQPLWVKILRQLNDPLIMIMIGAVIISTAIAIFEGHPSDLIDGGVILGIVVLNAVIGIVQEGKAESALQALKNMSQPYCTVVRDNHEMRVTTTDLVCGDIVVLSTGDYIPADLRLIESINLSVEESALTGESHGVDKQIGVLNNEKLPLGDRNNMAYSGGAVLFGRGKGVVVAIGMDTEVGKIASLIAEQQDQKTPLQKQLAKTAVWISCGVLFFAAIIFVAALFNKDPVVDAFMTAVAIAVAAIPEGLPAVVTIVLAIGVRKMSLRRAIIRNIPAVEVLGNTQVICSDKTGTLTQNKMTVVELYTIADKQYNANTKPHSQSQLLLADALVYCNDTKYSTQELLGDPTETALIDYARVHNLPILKGTHRRVDEKPFDSERKLMTVVVDDKSGRKAYTKGANDNLLKHCTHILDGTITRPITPTDKNTITQVCEKMASTALRVLGVAIKSDNLNSLESGMTFVGLCGMIDPPRPEVSAAVALCKQAGIKAIMITGDHAITASAIAKQIGIEGRVVLGAQLDAMSDDELDKCIMSCAIFARVSPQNKVRIVNTLKGKGLVVAMTGDGVNDAPSIKAADIGIGMGITGTDVSKGAADMVLADDNFATIVGAVEEGRRIYANIKKAIHFLLSANIAEVLSIFIISVFLRQPFLTPIMILLVNLITDSLPALALGTEKAEYDVMKHHPETSRKSLFAGRMGVRIILHGTIQTGLVMMTYLIAKSFDSVEDRLPLAMLFVTLIMVQLFHSINCRKDMQSIFVSNPFGNFLLNISFAIGVGLVAAIIYIPSLRIFFDLPMLKANELLIAIGIAALIIPIVEIYKFVERVIEK